MVCGPDLSVTRGVRALEALPPARAGEPQDSQEGIRAAQDEQALMADMNRPMDRRRAVEGHLMRVRGQLRPLRLDELVEG